MSSGNSDPNKTYSVLLLRPVQPNGEWGFVKCRDGYHRFLWVPPGQQAGSVLAERHVQFRLVTEMHVEEWQDVTWNHQTGNVSTRTELPKIGKSLVTSSPGQFVPIVFDLIHDVQPVDLLAEEI